jgi:pimeloyl-ACP methyl ester carboxylesterase
LVDFPSASDGESRTIASFDGTPLGVNIAGPRDAPVLLLANGLGANAAAFRFVRERFADKFRFVAWDYRGLFSSGRPVRGYDALGVDDHARDALRVLDALEATEVHALGWSMGVQVLLETVRLAPDRFDTMVLHAGVPGRPWATFARGAFKGFARRAVVASQHADAMVAAAVRGMTSWRSFVPLAIRLGLVHHDVDRAVFGEVAEGFASLDMHVLLEILRRLGDHDAYDVLPDVACPTLVLAGTEDRIAPLSIAQQMARDIPGATLALLPGGTHYASVEMPALFCDHLEQFWKIAGLLE